MAAKLGGGRVGAVLVHAALQPLRQSRETGFESDLRMIAEDLTGLGNVSEAVANVAGTVVSGHDRRQLLLAEHLAELPDHFQHAVGCAATDIEDFVAGGIALERENTSRDKIAHVHEVAPLMAILEDHRRL